MRSKNKESAIVICFPDLFPSGVGLGISCWEEAGFVIDSIICGGKN